METERGAGRGGGRVLRLYDHTLSGNCYKIRLLLSQLEIPYDRVAVKLLHEGPRGDDSMRKNPIGRVPVVELTDGRVLSESNAILFYLADGTPLLPSERFDRARVLRWMFFEQNGPEPSIGGARYQVSILKDPGGKPDLLASRQAAARSALRAMNRGLERREFFVDRYSVADIALYAYAHVAPGMRGPRSRAWFAPRTQTARSSMRASARNTPRSSAPTSIPETGSGSLTGPGNESASDRTSLICWNQGG